MDAQLLEKIRNKYSAANVAQVTAANAAIAPLEAGDFRDWPEYRQVAAIEGFFAGENPYCAPREGTIGRQVTIAGRDYDTFCGYNYLGYNGSQAVEKAVIRALRRHGSSASASRVAGGECDIHRELESALAAHLGSEDTIVTVGGYIANVACIRFLMGEGDLILFDEYCHNSLIEGCASSKARRMQFHHNNLDHLEKLLASQRNQHRRALIVVESVYSMDGDIVDLARLVDIKRRHNAYLMVDEAHSIGVLGERGRGLCEHAGVDPREVDILMGTLSKSLASCGGFIAGSRALTGLLRYIAPGFLLYSAGIPPTSCAASLAVLQILATDNSQVLKLQQNAARFRAIARELELDTGLADTTPIVPVMLGAAGDSVEKMAWVTRELFRRGIHVVGITYPVVPRNEARLRFFLTAEHSEDQYRRALTLTREVMREILEVQP
ncbi:aminotransferase class I/II-fold pyridoxal phosphate-dependent enzyme [Microbulbifer rhizosphaerae]|uniref:8-amino-7-oxononanoate synthase n=1 Tax=Microbulbifer rhizosphaerae TaxID=1562603 RepID=A0A7W4ZAM7_9GAMM|nr:aminotransferase class I/II-fold pyridoxal phosphate-dependent enzyme [Microbulbifer rhizosphaerae]MBB3061499.1 8-amino-7-oxononanoate synthase [Microbulbifer rhizosphaerae]